jgi:hypothetical protein
MVKMEKYSKNDIYRETSNALIKALKRAGDKINLTFTGVSTKEYINYFAEDVYKFLKKNKKENFKANTATLWKILEASIRGTDNWSKKKRRFFAKEIVRLVMLKTGDPFCKKGYLRMPKNEAYFFLENIINKKPTKTTLQVLLWAVAEKKYGAQHTLVEEVHGPYNFKNNNFIFYDFSIPGFPQIRIISMFNKLAIFEFDVFNNYIFSERPLKQWVTAGNKVLSQKDIKKLNRLLLRKLNEKNRFPKDSAEKLIFVFRILWLDFKQLNPKAKIPKKLIEKIRGKKNWVKNINKLFV